MAIEINIGGQKIWSAFPVQEQALIRPEVEILYGGARGGGKCLKIKDMVLTPFGFRPMGSMRVGQAVTNPDGSIAQVIGVYPQGPRQFYRVTFHDGSSIETTEEHLWLAWQSNKSRKRNGKRKSSEESARLWTTKQMMELQGKKQRFLIPVTEAVPFNVAAKFNPRPLQAYTLGVLLGDGSIGTAENVSFYSADPEIPQRVALETGEDIRSSPNRRGHKGSAYRFLRHSYVIGALEKLGLLGTHSNTKFIPEAYLLAPTQERWELLRGLMDTDGCADADGDIYYCTVSPQLRDDVVALARSLGAVVTTVVKHPKYIYKGEVKEGQLAFNIRIKLRNPSNAFYLKRKAARARAPQSMYRAVVSIEPTDIAEAQCIQVNHPNGLFLTNDYIVTHNTECGMIWLLMGNTEPTGTVADAGYYHHPHYRALVLRKNVSDMGDWLVKAKRFYSQLGAKSTDRPLEFTFPSGAVIVVGHLDDKDSYEKYQGQEFARILIEELTQIPNADLYLRVMASCRSPFDELRRQIFLTANPGGPGHCLREGEVLTPHGWKPIQDFRPGDAVFTINGAGEMVRSSVAQVHASEFDGELVQAKARGFFLECTEDHRVAKAGITRAPGSQNMETFSLVPFSALPGQATILRSVSWTGYAYSGISVPMLPGRRKHKQPLTLTPAQSAELMGWYLAEGCTIARDKAFSIAQLKEENRPKIRALLNACGFKHSWGEKGATVYSPEWFEYLRRYGKSRHKFIPQALKDAPPSILRLLLGALMAGDGHWNSETGGTYYTISSLLAADVEEVALKCGYIVFTSTRQRVNRKGPSYQVNIKKVTSGGTELLTGNHVYAVGTLTQRRSDVHRVPYKGPVYCIGIPDTHSFIVKQRGCVWISGNSWVRERFIEPMKPGAPFIDPVTGISRVFIPARVQDNPIYADDKQYIGQLMALSPATRRAWLEGDWDAIAGEYFEEFRIAPRIGEPACARHVVDSTQVKLEPWYYRWLSCDWGYSHNSAVYKACQLPNGQIHVYDELVLNKTTPEDLGVEIAKFLWPEIYDGSATQRGFTLFLSHEMFGKRTEERTGADQIAAGIEKVLGPNSSLVFYDEVEQALPNAALQQQRAVSVRRAPNQRIAGWMHVKSLMRWWPVLGTETPGFDPAYALRLFSSDRAKWRSYCDLFKREDEVLPKLQIWGDRCPKLVRAIPSARSNDPDRGDPEDIIKSHWDGADCVDSLRYLLFSAKFMRTQEPWEVFYARHLEKHYPQGLASLAPGSAVWIARKAEADFKALTSAHDKPIHFNISRAKASRQRARDASRMKP